MRVTSIFLLVSILLFSMVAAETEEAAKGEDFKGEFLQGMETGFFLRDTKDGHLEYNCMEPSLNSDILKKVQSIFGPVQALLKLADNDMVNLGLRMLDTILN